MLTGDRGVIRKLCIALLFVPLVAVAGVEVAVAQAPAPVSEVELDLAAWERLAVRAEEVLAAGAASDSALRALRSQLVEWTERAIQRQAPLLEKIDRLNAQIEALGEPAGEGETESEQISERHSQLAEELGAVNTPFRIAEEVKRRAKSLIEGIDRIIQERWYEKLFSLNPSPVVPANWIIAFDFFRDYLGDVQADFASALASDAQRMYVWQKLPSTILLLALGLLFLTYGRRWLARFSAAVSSRLGVRDSRSDAGIPLAVTAFAAPTFGVYLFVAALESTGIELYRTNDLLQAIPIMAAFVFFAQWLSIAIFSEYQASMIPRPPSVAWSASARTVVSFLGWVSAIKILFDVMLGDAHGNAEARSVLTFIITLGGCAVLYRLSRIFSVYVAQHRIEGERQTIWDRSISVLASILLAVVVASPVAAITGYTSAASFAVFPLIGSLGLLGAFVTVQKIISGILLVVLRVGRADEQSGAFRLASITAGILLFFVSLPLLARIWGAADSNLASYWEMAKAGISVGGARITVTDAIVFFIVFAVGATITRLVQTLLRSSILPNTKLDSGAQNAITTGTGYVGVFLAAVVAVSVAGINLTGLAIVAGALSVGVGFGLQTIVSNFVSGMILLIERPVTEGDWIEADGVSGTVKRISVRSTLIETFDKATVVVPNNDLMSNQVTNWTLGNRLGRTIVRVGIAYGTDPRRVERILLELAKEHPNVLSDPPPRVVFQQFGADALEFDLRVILEDVNYILSAKSDLNFAIAERFEKEGITIPFPQRDIWIRNADELANSLWTNKSSGGKGDNQAL